MAHTTRALLTALALMTLIIACEEKQNRSEAQFEEAPDPRLFGTDHLAPRVIAERYLRGMADEARVYWERHQETWDPSLPGLSFPMSTPLTPAVMPCGTAVMVNPVDWTHPTWRALHFPPPDPLRFSYQFESSGTGRQATFTASAYGDTDCDGIVATFQRTGLITSTGNIQSLGEIFAVNPDE